MRICSGCGKLKYNKCSLGFNALKSEKTSQILRPKECHKKYRHSDKKQSKLDYQSLIKQIDDAFQMYIRYRDGWRCVVCGKEIPPSTEGAKSLMHGGHFISRGYMPLRWDEANCHAQCAGCNYNQSQKGIDPRYTAYMTRKYGSDIFDYFVKQYHRDFKYSAAELADILKMWQDKLAIIKEIYHNSLK